MPFDFLAIFLVDMQYGIGRKSCPNYMKYHQTLRINQISTGHDINKLQYYIVHLQKVQN